MNLYQRSVSVPKKFSWILFWTEYWIFIKYILVQTHGRQCTNSELEGKLKIYVMIKEYQIGLVKVASICSITSHYQLQWELSECWYLKHYFINFVNDQVACAFSPVYNINKFLARYVQALVIIALRRIKYWWRPCGSLWKWNEWNKLTAGKIPCYTPLSNTPDLNLLVKLLCCWVC